jgi:hypothetical protein
MYGWSGTFPLGIVVKRRYFANKKILSTLRHIRKPNHYWAGLEPIAASSTFVIFSHSLCLLFPHVQFYFLEIGYEEGVPATDFQMCCFTQSSFESWKAGWLYFSSLQSFLR